MLAPGVELRNVLHDLGCTDAAYIALAAPPMTHKKLSSQVIGLIKSGQRDFENAEEAEEFIFVTRLMQNLQDTIARLLGIYPSVVPIDWTRVIEVRPVLISLWEKNREEADPRVLRAMVVSLTRLHYFKEIRNGEVVRTVNISEAAAFTGPELAHLCVMRLKKEYQTNATADVQTLTPNRRRSSITTRLEDIGFSCG